MAGRVWLETVRAELATRCMVPIVPESREVAHGVGGSVRKAWRRWRMPAGIHNNHAEVSFVEVYGAMPGLRQSIDAAEIYAAIMALRFACGAIVRISDSSLVVGGWQAGRAWCVAASRPNADLWCEFWRAAEDIGCENISVEKVKAHTTEAAVQKGEISARDRYGNALADEFAKKGARLHRTLQATRDRAADLRLQSKRLAGWIARGLTAAAASLAILPNLTAKDKEARGMGEAQQRARTQSGGG